MTASEIRELRLRHGLRQRDMADELGVHLRTYQQWEYGRHRPGASTVKALRDLAERLKRRKRK